MEMLRCVLLVQVDDDGALFKLGSCCVNSQEYPLATGLSSYSSALSMVSRFVAVSLTHTHYDMLCYRI